LRFELFVVLYGPQTVPDSWAGDGKWSVTKSCPCPWCSTCDTSHPEKKSLWYF